TIPNIVFASGQQQFSDGVVRCITGDGGLEVWTAGQASARVWSTSNLALGDVDNDGVIDVIGQSYVAGDPQAGNKLVAINGSDGSFEWFSQPFIGHPAFSVPPGSGAGGGAPAIADIDCDGWPEVICGANVFHGGPRAIAGTYFWRP